MDIELRNVLESDFDWLYHLRSQIITMEWIVEGVALIFIAFAVAIVTHIDFRSPVSKSIYWLSFVMLNTLTAVSFFTGFKINFLPFKLCPILFTTASILILAGSYV